MVLFICEYIDVLESDQGQEQGSKEKALGLASKAAEIQAGMPFRYGPPRISKPTAELLGDIYTAVGDHEQAALAYEDQLSRSQMRTNSLLGLARSSAQAGDDIASRAAYQSLADIWHNADATLPTLSEVKDQTSSQ